MPLVRTARARKTAFARARVAAPRLGACSRLLTVFTERMTGLRAPRLVSVGYEGKDVQELIQYLLQSRVGVLVDVRLNPISRKPGLSKTRLAAELRRNGIKYLHLRELGNPRDNREGFRAGDENAFTRFRSLLQNEAADRALGHVSELLDHEVVALLCFESDHSACHRGLVAEALATKVPELAIDAG